MITKKTMIKFVIAFVLTVVTIAGSDIVAEEIGIDSGPVVYACGHNGGGGC